jgi:hypothetical protein
VHWLLLFFSASLLSIYLLQYDRLMPPTILCYYVVTSCHSQFRLQGNAQGSGARTLQSHAAEDGVHPIGPGNKMIVSSGSSLSESVTGWPLWMSGVWLPRIRRMPVLLRAPPSIFMSNVAGRLCGLTNTKPFSNSPLAARLHWEADGIRRFKI